jgi:hypothetical protein
MLSDIDLDPPVSHAIANGWRRIVSDYCAGTANLILPTVVRVRPPARARKRLPQRRIYPAPRLYLLDNSVWFARSAAA